MDNPPQPDFPPPGNLPSPYVTFPPVIDSVPPSGWQVAVPGPDWWNPNRIAENGAPLPLPPGLNRREEAAWWFNAVRQDSMRLPPSSRYHTEAEALRQLNYWQQMYYRADDGTLGVVVAEAQPIEPPYYPGYPPEYNELVRLCWAHGNKDPNYWACWLLWEWDFLLAGRIKPQSLMEVINMLLTLGAGGTALLGFVAGSPAIMAAAVVIGLLQTGISLYQGEIWDAAFNLAGAIIWPLKPVNTIFDIFDIYNAGALGTPLPQVQPSTFMKP